MLGEWVKRARNLGLEVALNRYYSAYQGKVVQNDDPHQVGRTKVTCPPMGRTTPLDDWTYPTSPFAGNNYGFYFPPEVGDSVWVWFENGESNSPNCAGSWYLNTDPNLTPGASHVPVEFRNTTASSPTRRGIKSKRGHGFMFEDGVDLDGAAKTSKVEFWSGTQPTGNVSATKNRYLRMQDSPAGEKTIVLASTSGHQTEWRDVTGQIWVRTKTAGGHQFFMDDTGKQILLKSTGGNKVLIDDNLNDITIQTIGNHKVVLSDSQKSIRVVSTGLNAVTLDDVLKGAAVETAGGRSMLMYDSTQVTTLTTPTGQVVTQSPAGTSLVDPGNVTVLAGGVLGLTGTGVSMTSASGGPTLQTASGSSTSNFTGDKTESFTGALKQTIQGLYSVTVTGLAKILSVAGVQIGTDSGPKYFLIDQRFLATFLAHVHTTTIIGAPTGPPFWIGPPPFPPAIGGVTTLSLSAN